MTHQVSYAVQKRGKEYRFVLLPTIPSGTVAFVSFSKQQQIVSNLNDQPFANAPLVIKGEDVVEGTLQASTPKDELLFFVNSPDNLYGVDVDPNGASKSFLGVYDDGKLQPLQTARVVPGGVVDILFIHEGNTIDLTVYVKAPSGDTLATIVLWAGQGATTFPVQTVAGLQHYLLDLVQGDPESIATDSSPTGGNPSPSGFTDQADLILQPEAT